MLDKKRISPKRRKYSIQKYSATVYLFTFIIFLSAIAIMQKQTEKEIDVLEEIYSENVAVHEVTRLLESTYVKLQDYIANDGPDILEAYYQNVEEYKEVILGFPYLASDSDIRLKGKNIRNMSWEMLEYGEMAIQYKSQGDVKMYNEYLEQMYKVKNYINIIVLEMNEQQVLLNYQHQKIILSSMKYLLLITGGAFLLIVFINSFFTHLVIRCSLKPFKNMVNASEKISRGDFEVDYIEDSQILEGQKVISAFNKMVESIKNYIIKMKESMEFERQTKEKELRMENYIKDTKYKFLRAQINPHFLFNTLNAGSQLAIMEEADRTAEFIDRLALFYKYCLKKSGGESNLIDEIEMAENYIYLLNVRFAGEINYTKNIACDIGNVKMPEAILQPIIENAVNHGIRGIEWEGQIHLKVYDDDENVTVEISDNGKGMPPEKIHDILHEKNDQGSLGEKSNGIAISNIRERLFLYFGRKNIFEVSSGGNGFGTTVMIRLPKIKEEEKNVQDFSC